MTDSALIDADPAVSRYRERAPHPDLAAHVQEVWAQDVRAEGLPYHQRIVPDGCADLLWRDGRLGVAGPDTAWRMAELVTDTAIVGLRFSPGAAALLFGGLAVSEAKDREVDLAELWGARRTRDLTERLADAGSTRAVALAMEGAMRARLPHAGEVDQVVRAAVRDLDSARPVSAVASALGFSERQLRRRFVTAVGYGPKTLQSVFRLHRAIGFYDSASPARGSDIAAAAGYADQSHMTREMRRLAGVTPGAFTS